MTSAGQSDGSASLVDQGIRWAGSGLEMLGVLVFVVGIAVATWLLLRDRAGDEALDGYKIRIGRPLLLGLEVLMAAHVVKTVAHELTFTGLGQLAGLIAIRTFLSWTLVLEIEGRWPWQKPHSTDPAASAAAKDR